MSPLRFFTAEDPDMALVCAIRRQVFVQDLGVPERQEFDAADLPGADTVYALLTAEGRRLSKRDGAVGLDSLQTALPPE